MNNLSVSNSRLTKKRRRRRRGKKQRPLLLVGQVHLLNSNIDKCQNFLRNSQRYMCTYTDRDREKERMAIDPLWKEKKHIGREERRQRNE